MTRGALVSSHALELLLRRAGPACLCALLMGQGLAAQQTPQAGARLFRIAGTVVNGETGEAVGRATVAVLAYSDSHIVESTVSDSEGHFALERLPAAKYQLTAAKRGYRTSFYDEHEEFSTAIVTGEGEQTGGIEFKLPPTAVVRGVVTADGGDAVEGAKVMLFKRPHMPAFDPGRDERTTLTATMLTDDTGAYEFDGLAPGEYMLAVAAEPWYAQHGPAGRRRAASVAEERNASLDVAYPVTFFDSTTDEGAAARIVLKDGSREEANIRLQAVPALHLTVETPRRQDGSIARAELRQTIFGIQTSAESMGFLDALKTGTVEFSGVAPGRYELVQGDPARVGELNAEASLHVDANLGAAAYSVSGYVHASGAKPESAAKGTALPGDLTLTLDPVGGRGMATEMQASTVGGAFGFPMVPAGNWELWAESGGLLLPGLSTRASGRAGGRASAGNRVTVRDRAVSLEVNIELGGARVEGFVRRAGKGVAGAMVVLVPNDPALLRAMARRDQSDSDGSFSLRNVAPGDYRVVAIEGGWEMDWLSPGALMGFTRRGVAVSVGEKAGQVLELSETVPAQGR